MNLFRSVVIFLFMTTSSVIVHAGELTQPDGSLRIRFNSVSFMPFSGKILNNRPSADLFVAYDWTVVSVYFFESSDLRTRRSDINYFQTGLFRNLNLSKAWSVTPYMILEIPQNNVYYDSPYWVTGGTLAWIPASRWKIENTTLLADGFKKSNQKDILNRLKVGYQPAPGWEASTFLWNNAAKFDGSGFCSTGVMVNVPVISTPVAFSLSAMYFHIVSKNASVASLNQGVNISIIAAGSFR